MMITDIEEYFTKGCGRCNRFDTEDCSTVPWREGLKALRRICNEMGLEENVKWAHPCYMHAGRNICLIGAVRGDFRLNFMNSSLLKDPEGILEKQGENTEHADCIRFTNISQVAEREVIIRAYLREAMDYAEKGIRPEKTTREFEWPEELIDALDNDPELSEAFHALTKGRQNSYLLHFNSAKQSATRVSRIEKSREKILAGLGQNEYKK